MRVPGGGGDSMMADFTPPPAAPQPEGPNDMSMGGDPMPDDMNNEEPEGMNNDNEENDVNGVDNKAQKAAGELSYILPDASEETVDYVMGMIAPAVGKNSNVGDNDIEKWSEKMSNNDDSSDEDEENSENPEGEEDTQENEPDDNMPMESIKLIKNIITETLKKYID